MSLGCRDVIRFLSTTTSWSTTLAPTCERSSWMVFQAVILRPLTTRAVISNCGPWQMAKTGFSPPTRIFEAAGAGVCLITDAWEGIENFFTPEAEILIARSARDIVNHLKRLSAAEASNIGSAMLKRALSEHTYETRAREVHAALQTLFSEETSSRFQPDAVGYKLSQVPV